MKTRFTPILLILVIIVAAILSRFIGDSNYILAATNGSSAYRFFYCPYNKLPYTSPNFPYPGLPAIRLPYPTDAPWLKQYPCPCTSPGINEVLLDSDEQY